MRFGPCHSRPAKGPLCRDRFAVPHQGTQQQIARRFIEVIGRLVEQQDVWLLIQRSAYLPPLALPRRQRRPAIQLRRVQRQSAMQSSRFTVVGRGESLDRIVTDICRLGTVCDQGSHRIETHRSAVGDQRALDQFQNGRLAGPVAADDAGEPGAERDGEIGEDRNGGGIRERDIEKVNGRHGAPRTNDTQQRRHGDSYECANPRQFRLVGISAADPGSQGRGSTAPVRHPLARLAHPALCSTLERYQAGASR